ncbi:MAG: hypothetical protein QXG39_05135 [Candidatus Aenigmatarchaeota archaeon]
MVKVIKVHDENYIKLLEILHQMEKERKKRLSFDDVISFLIERYHLEKNLKDTR